MVCHTLPLFGKSTLGIISFDFLYDSFTRALPLLSFSVALPRLSFTVLSVFTLPSTISRARRCSRQYADAVLALRRSFLKRSGSAHIIYIPGVARGESSSWTVLRRTQLRACDQLHVYTHPSTAPTQQFCVGYICVMIAIMHCFSECCTADSWVTKAMWGHWD